MKSDLNIKTLCNTYSGIYYNSSQFWDSTIAIVSHYYPEHVYTWEGYGNRFVRSCVCECVCF